MATAEAVRSFAQLIERELDEIEQRKKSIKAIYKHAAKSSDFNAVALRGVIAERRKKKKPPNAELEAKKAEYRAALAEPGATVRSAAEKTGVPKSTGHRWASKKTPPVPREENREENGTTPPVVASEPNADGLDLPVHLDKSQEKTAPQPSTD